MIKEFKEFISKGNVIDLAVGVIVGGAFGKIVSSLVNDVIMPLIGILLGGLDFKTLSFTVGKSTVLYGNFIQTIVDFFIIALCIFIIIKLINKFRKKKEKAEEAPVLHEPTKEELLLTEIRDLLKKK